MKGIQSMTLAEKVKAKVKISESGCWEAQDAPLRDGYVLIRHKGKKLLGHRVAYQEFVGPIPHGLSILHSCDNRKCWNPKHLQPGTYSDNSKDATMKGRQKNLFKSGPDHPRWKGGK